MKKPQAWEWVDDEAGLARVVRALSATNVLAVDTESDSMHSYFEKVCLLQLATRDAAFVVDPLALRGKLGGLAPAFADRGIRKVFHGADYDVVSMKRDFEYEILGIFDTMVAAQCLGVERIGLADLVEEEFGDHLEKKYSRMDWARRPLSESELLYSYLDVKYLIELSEAMERKLAAASVLEEARVEFARLEERSPTPRVFDPDDYLRIRGSRDLAPRALSVLRELFVMRDKQARRLNRPPFKVLANDTLLRVARQAPLTREALAGTQGVTSFVMRRHGEPILRAVIRGLERGKPPAPRKKAPREARLTPLQQRQIERLKEWRKAVAVERGQPTLVVLPNHAIQEVVRGAPADLSALALLPTVGEKRARLHGEAILSIIAGPRRGRRKKA